MGFYELFLIAVGLSMDAFAVALCKGLCMPKLNQRHAMVIATAFGGFQALNPFIGWFIGRQFARYITNFDHWIAFGLLALIGGKMIWEAQKEKDVVDECDYRLDLKELGVLAIATSIDALAVGVTFAFLNIQIVPSIITIGLTTFAISLMGVNIGHRFGSRMKGKAEIVGGTVLILIGLKILLEHLNILTLIVGNR